MDKMEKPEVEGKSITELLKESEPKQTEEKKEEIKEPEKKRRRRK